MHYASRKLLAKLSDRTSDIFKLQTINKTMNAKLIYLLQLLFKKYKKKIQFKKTNESYKFKTFDVNILLELVFEYLVRVKCQYLPLLWITSFFFVLALNMLTDVNIWETFVKSGNNSLLARTKCPKTNFKPAKLTQTGTMLI